MDPTEAKSFAKNFPAEEKKWKLNQRGLEQYVYSRSARLELIGNASLFLLLARSDKTSYFHKIPEEIMKRIALIVITPTTLDISRCSFSWSYYDQNNVSESHDSEESTSYSLDGLGAYKRSHSSYYRDNYTGETSNHSSDTSGVWRYAGDNVIECAHDSSFKEGLARFVLSKMQVGSTTLTHNRKVVTLSMSIEKHRGEM